MNFRSTSYKYEGLLSALLVDQYSEYINEALREFNYSKKDIIRFRFSIENAMCKWLDTIGGDAKCSLVIRKRFHRVSIKLLCEGIKCDPRESDETEFGTLSDFSLLQTLGFSIGYSYENGANTISIMPQKGAGSNLLPLFISIISGVLLATVIHKLFPQDYAIIAEQYVSPVFNVLMNILRTIAGPLIFLAVLSGIYGIGDMDTLGKIGRKLIGRYVIMTYVALIISLPMLLYFVPVSSGMFTLGNGTMDSLISLILQFIPTDIVSPFLNGNMLQIIFLAVACGAGMLILGNSVSSLNSIIQQIYSVVQLLMETIGEIIPLFVFISILDFSLSGSVTDIKAFIVPILIIGTSFLVLLLSYLVRIKIKLGVGFLKNIKKHFLLFCSLYQQLHPLQPFL